MLNRIYYVIKAVLYFIISIPLLAMLGYMWRFVSLDFVADSIVLCYPIVFITCMAMILFACIKGRREVKG